VTVTSDFRFRFFSFSALLDEDASVSSESWTEEAVVAVVGTEATTFEVRLCAVDEGSAAGAY
jgi:hypothetical protein